MALNLTQETWVQNAIAKEQLEKDKEALIKTANEQKSVKANEIAAIDVKLTQDLQAKDDEIKVLEVAVIEK